MARTPFPFSVCKECAGSGGTGGGGLTELDVIEIIKENTQKWLGGDDALPPSLAFMVEFINTQPWSEDIQALNELVATLPTREEYNNHDMRIENLELANGDIETALDNIIAIQNSLIGGGSV